MSVKSSLLLFLLVAAGCAPKCLVQDALPTIKSRPGLATCVILMVEGNSDEFTPVYCDTKPVAGLEDISMAVFDVEPGVHHIIAESGNDVVYRIDFQPGKVYFFKMLTFETPVHDGVRMSLIKREIAEHLIQSHRPRHLTLNPKRAFDDYDPSDLQEQVQEYLEWEKEHPEEAREVAEYGGYTIE